MTRMRNVPRELCEAARAGDCARFDRLFDAWLHLVYGAALWRTGERVRAETLTHDLLVGAIQVVLAGWSDKPDESTNEPGKIAAAQ